MTVVGCAGRADCTSTGCGDPFSSFSRATSDSSALSRLRTSVRRFFDLTARAINQIGIPRTIKMTSVILFSTRHSTLLRALCTATRTSTTTRAVLVGECLFYLPRFHEIGPLLQREWPDLPGSIATGEALR